jgi:hypothetical protein
VSSTLAVPLKPTVARAKGPTLRIAAFDDYDRLAELQREHGLSVKPRDEWLHLWQGNPAYVPGWPIGWVLEAANGRLVGSLENVPCLYRMRGRSYLAAFGRGWAADLQYRAFAMMLIIKQLQQRGVDLRLTSTASPRTSELLLQRGWSRVPAGEWDRSGFWVTNYPRAARSLLRSRIPGPLATVAAAAAYPALRVANAFTGRPRSSPTGHDLCWTDEFDQRFDRFWRETEQANPDVLLSVRDRETLNWHFKFSLEQNRLWILTAHRGPRMVAYTIFQRREIQSLKLSRIMLVDYQTLDPDPRLASNLMASAWERCRREGMDVLENFGCWMEPAAAVRAPHHRDFESWCYLYQAEGRELKEGLESAGAWRPTQYDADASL